MIAPWRALTPVAAEAAKAAGLGGTNQPSTNLVDQYIELYYSIVYYSIRVVYITLWTEVEPPSVSLASGPDAMHHHALHCSACACTHATMSEPTPCVFTMPRVHTTTHQNIPTQRSTTRSIEPPCGSLVCADTTLSRPAVARILSLSLYIDIYIERERYLHNIHIHICNNNTTNQQLSNPL